VFFNKNIHRDEIASLIFILPRLILRDPENRALFEQIMERIDNIVCLEESVYDLPAVIFDRAAAARMAVEHLVNLGHQKIAFLALEDERLTGYKHALLEHGLVFDECHVRVFCPGIRSGASSHICLPCYCRTDRIGLPTHGDICGQRRGSNLGPGRGARPGFARSRRYGYHVD
jgi:hypothetical protein